MNRKLQGLTVAALLGLSCTGLLAQTRENAARIGLFGNYSMDMHSAAFTQLPGVPNCCPEFTGGSGSGFFGGITYWSPLDNTMWLDLRLHYGVFGATLKETQTLPTTSATGESVNASIEHTLEGSFTQISVEPMLAYRITPEFSLRGGLMAGLVLNGTYDQSETMLEPANGTFESGQRTRNATSGDITDVNQIALGITVGASYDLALNSSRSMFLSPEVLFTYRPMNLVTDVDWTVSHLRFGLALTIVPPEVSDSLDEFQLYDVARRTPLPRKGEPGVKFVPDVVASGISEDGRSTSQTSIRIEEFASTRIRPLLPYVFFDENADAIHPRYRPLTQDQVDVYSLDNFYNLDALVTYRQLLNIVGKRMTDDKNATITLTGCTDESESAAGDLGKRRAEAVKAYIVGTWGIDGSRISVVSKGMPSTPSNPKEEDGRAENRRVEISASSDALLAPVTSADTLRQFEPAGFRFSPTLDPRVPIANWTVFVSEDESIIRTFHGSEPIPAMVDWRVAEQSAFIPRGTRKLEYMFVVQDSSGTVVPSEMRIIPVSEVTLADKKRSGGTDKTIDRYSMILFAFDKADLSKENQELVSAIKSRIASNSSVKITGYTDRSGAEDYNQRLSEQRARSVANALGAGSAVVTGLGERLPLYDNSSPEGRFYSRTVEVVVETPRQ